MTRTEIVCVGRIKEAYLRDAADEYAKRLSRFTRLVVKEIPEGKSVEAEGGPILRACTGYRIALCVEGQKMSSEVLAGRIKTLCDEGRTMSFIIGSSCGLSDEVKEAADLRLSFSDMTFPHQLMRVILLEQIYRGFMINSGGEYHK